VPLDLSERSDDGKQANRVEVFLGRAPDDRVQIAQGLLPGEQSWHRYDHLQLK